VKTGVGFQGSEIRVQGVEVNLNRDETNALSQGHRLQPSPGTAQSF
jgi:hypothetical protein